MSLLSFFHGPVLRRLNHLEEILMSALDDVVARVNASVQANTTAVQSAVQAINDLRAQVAAGQDASATVTTLGQIADQLDGATTALNNAVVPPAPPAPSDAPAQPSA